MATIYRLARSPKGPTCTVRPVGAVRKPVPPRAMNRRTRWGRVLNRNLSWIVARWLARPPEEITSHCDLLQNLFRLAQPKFARRDVPNPRPLVAAPATRREYRTTSRYVRYKRTPRPTIRSSRRHTPCAAVRLIAARGLIVVGPPAIRLASTQSMSNQLRPSVRRDVGHSLSISS